MGFTSQAGQVLLRSQAVQGTFQADIATVGVSVRLRSGGLGTNRDLLITDPEIGGGRDVTDALLGAASWGGDFEFYARVDALATLLKACLGTAAAPVTATGVTTHTITPVDSGTLPYLSIEENLGGTLETYNYTDAIVNTLHLESEANGYLMGTAGIIAAKQIAGATKTASPTKVDTTSFFVGDLTAKRREVTASFSIRESSSALWRQATYGTSAATGVGGVTTKSPLVITCSTYA